MFALHMFVYKLQKKKLQNAYAAFCNLAEVTVCIYTKQHVN